VKVRMFAHSGWRVGAALALAACVVFQNIPIVKGGNHPERVHLAKPGPGRDLARAESENAAAQPRAAEALGKSAISFEMNQGQFDPEVKFLARAGGCNVFLTSSGVAFKLASNLVDKSQAPGKSRDLAEFQNDAQGAAFRSTVRMGFAGASTRVRLSGLERLPGRTNYLKGNNPRKWRTDIPSFAKVKYESLYPGIDLVYYGNDGRLEYDLKLAPGADPAAVAIEVEGADNVATDERGTLVAHTAAGDLRQELPAIYQEIGGTRQLVAGNYVMKGGGRVGFQLGDYDTSKALTIDPSIVYSTKLGGNNNSSVNAIAVDFLGNTYITGSTQATDFPTKNPFQGSLKPGGDGTDAFVAKLDQTGAIVYSTYLGGSGTDIGYGIAVDPLFGDAYVTGLTGSTDFPLMNALQGASGGNGDAFITHLNPDGNGLLYSTYLGGSGLDHAFGIAVDQGGNAYVTGRTFSTNFPTKNAFRAAKATTLVEDDAFVTVISADGSTLIYGTYFGGTGFEEGHSIAVDGQGNAYVTGFTTSGGGDFPTTPGVLESASGGGQDAFVAKFNPGASGPASLVYSTFLGGNGTDTGNGIAVDSTGNAYVVGTTASANLPRTGNAFQFTLNGPSDAFVTKLNQTGTSLVYGTYLGGSAAEAGNSIAVDFAGKAHVAGITSSTNFPTTSDALQAAYGGGTEDAFVATIDPTGSKLEFSTYTGGSGPDEGRGIAVDSIAQVYIGFTSASNNFPMAIPGSTDRAIRAEGPDDRDSGYVHKHGRRCRADVSVTLEKSVTGQVGAYAKMVVTVENHGPDTVDDVSLTVDHTITGRGKETDSSVLMCGKNACNLGTFAPGHFEQFIFQIKLDGPGSVEVTARAQGNCFDPVETNNIDTSEMVIVDPSYDGCFVDKDKGVLVRFNSKTGDYSIEFCEGGRPVKARGQATPSASGVVIDDPSNLAGFSGGTVITVGAGMGHLDRIDFDGVLDVTGPVSASQVCDCPPAAPPFIYDPNPPPIGESDSEDLEVAEVLSLAQGTTGSNVNPSDAGLNLSATVTPAEPSIGLSFSQPTISPGQRVTFTVKTTNTPANTYTVRVVAGDGQRVAAANFTIKVKGPAFVLGFDNPVVIGQASSSQTVQVKVVRDSGFNGNVTVNPPDLSALRIKVKPGSVATTDASASFRFKIKGSSPPGVYLLTFTGQDNSGGLAGGTFILVIE
jgi:hypothetical protein